MGRNAVILGSRRMSLPFLLCKVLYFYVRTVRNAFFFVRFFFLYFRFSLKKLWKPKGSLSNQKKKKKKSLVSQKPFIIKKKKSFTEETWSVQFAWLAVLERPQTALTSADQQAQGVLLPYLLQGRATDQTTAAAASRVWCLFLPCPFLLCSVLLHFSLLHSVRFSEPAFLFCLISFIIRMPTFELSLWIEVSSVSQKYLYYRLLWWSRLKGRSIQHISVNTGMDWGLHESIVCLDCCCSLNLFWEWTVPEKEEEWW